MVSCVTSKRGMSRLADCCLLHFVLQLSVQGTATADRLLQSRCGWQDDWRKLVDGRQAFQSADDLGRERRYLTRRADLGCFLFGLLLLCVGCYPAGNASQLGSKSRSEAGCVCHTA